MKYVIGRLLGFFLFIYSPLFGQNEFSIKGNVETNFQYLNSDTIIGAVQPDSKALLNAYANVFANYGGFRAGLRLESYLPRIQGYPDRFEGTGLGMRYVAWGNSFVDVTLGTIYEQFGSGLLLRAYEDRALGYDNALDGIRLKLTPYKGITVKGVYGNQRLSFTGGKIIKSTGVTRGLDVEFSLGEIFKKIEEKELVFNIAGSFVSKFQKDDNEEFVLPQNVGSYGARMEAMYKGFTLNMDYARKENDPSVDNGYSYNTGQAALINLGYSRKGLGILLSAKSVENMSFRSDRTKTLQDLFINYLPALTKTHTYNLVATLYPYATQPMGEVAFQGEVIYTVKRGSKLGGKYGMPIELNFSTAYAPIHHTTGYGMDSSRVLYKANLFDKSNEKYWQDFNIKISRKFNKHFGVSLSYYNIQLNNDISKVSNDATGIINSHIGVVELDYKINSKHALRAEIQGLFTKKDKGDWATLVLEYTISPNWFISVIDQYNFGNPDKTRKLHHIVGAFGYTRESSRIMVSYGRQRAGIFCVGGVCRYVPASNGLSIMFTQSF